MKALASLSYKECPPLVSAEAMRFLDSDTKRSRVSSPTFQLFEEPQFSIDSLESASNEFMTAIDAGYALMNKAGKALFNRVCKTLGENKDGKSVAIFVGGGNNGGDGLVLARLLIEAGIPSTVYSLAKPETFKDEAALAYKDFADNGGKLIVVNDLPEQNPEFALVVD